MLGAIVLLDLNVNRVEMVKLKRVQNMKRVTINQMIPLDLPT